MAEQNTLSHWNPAPRRRRALRQSNEPKDARYIREFYRKVIGVEDCCCSLLLSMNCSNSLSANCSKCCPIMLGQAAGA